MREIVGFRGFGLAGSEKLLAIITNDMVLNAKGFRWAGTVSCRYVEPLCYRERMAATFLALGLFSWATAIGLTLSDNTYAQQSAWMIPWLWATGVVLLIGAIASSRWFGSIFQRTSASKREEVRQETHGGYSPIAGRDVVQHFHSPKQEVFQLKRPRLSIGGYCKCTDAEGLMYGAFEFLSISNDGDESAQDIKIVPLRIGEWNIEFDQLPLLRPTQSERIRVRSIQKTVGYEDGVAQLKRAQCLDSAWRDAIAAAGDLGKLPIKVLYRDFKPSYFATVCSIQRDVLNRGGLPFLIDDCQDVEVEPIPPLGDTY